MTEQPPSAEDDLREWFWRCALNLQNAAIKSTPQIAHPCDADHFADDAMRRVEQRVSAETERCADYEAALNEIWRLQNANDGFKAIMIAAQALQRSGAIRAPAERPAPIPTYGPDAVGSGPSLRPAPEGPQPMREATRQGFDNWAERKLPLDADPFRPTDGASEPRLSAEHRRSQQQHVSPASGEGRDGVSGLQRICKMYGGMVINGKRFAWDYAIDRAVAEAEMTKERWAASEKARAANILRLLADRPEGGAADG